MGEWTIDSQAGWGLIVLTVGFFQVVHYVLSYLPLPQSVKQSDEFHVFRWRNLVVSFVHACLTGSACAYCLIRYRAELWEDMLNFVNWPCFCVSCFSTGYFLYDTLDIVVHHRIVEKWEILIHHFAILTSAAYVVSNVHCIGYHVLSMSIELNTAFLHSRKLLQLSNLPHHHPLVQVNVVVNLITFLIFRILPLSIVTVAIYRKGHLVPLWFAVEFTICMITLNFINVILLYRLVRSDFRHSGLFAPQKSATSNGDVVKPTIDQQLTANGVGHSRAEEMMANGDAKRVGNGDVATAISNCFVSNGDHSKLNGNLDVDQHVLINGQSSQFNESIGQMLESNNHHSTCL